MRREREREERRGEEGERYLGLSFWRLHKSF